MLFAQTVRVLKKINKPGNMIVAFTALAEQIKVCEEVGQSGWGKAGAFSFCSRIPGTG